MIIGLYFHKIRQQQKKFEILKTFLQKIHIIFFLLQFQRVNIIGIFCIYCEQMCDTKTLNQHPCLLQIPIQDLKFKKNMVLNLDI